MGKPSVYGNVLSNIRRNIVGKGKVLLNIFEPTVHNAFMYYLTLKYILYYISLESGRKKAWTLFFLIVLFPRTQILFGFLAFFAFDTWTFRAIILFLYLSRGQTLYVFALENLLVCRQKDFTVHGRVSDYSLMRFGVRTKTKKRWWL